LVCGSLDCPVSCLLCLNLDPHKVYTCICLSLLPPSLGLSFFHRFCFFIVLSPFLFLEMHLFEGFYVRPELAGGLVWRFPLSLYFL